MKAHSGARFSPRWILGNLLPLNGWYTNECAVDRYIHLKDSTFNSMTIRLLNQMRSSYWQISGCLMTTSITDTMGTLRKLLKLNAAACRDFHKHKEKSHELEW